jgi:double-stranded uracil-DNA glycosylase
LLVPSRAGYGAGVEVLPDLVGPEPVVVFCGQAGAESRRTREHYYETPGNSFWESLHLSGLSPTALRPEDDRSLPELGLGLTDLVGHERRAWVEWDELEAKVARWRPEWVAFTSKSAGAEAARALGARRPAYGVAPFEVAGAGVFVLPGTSGANRRHDYDGRPNRLAWWRDLAAIVEPDLALRRTRPPR